jgi:hypothetical protein
MKLHEFYRQFASLPIEKRNEPIPEVRYDVITPFFLFKQMEEVKKMQRFFQLREEELLRIAEGYFNKKI